VGQFSVQILAQFPVQINASPLSACQVWHGIIEELRRAHVPDFEKKAAMTKENHQ
jgi:hypothetical protein